MAEFKKVNTCKLNFWKVKTERKTEHVLKASECAVLQDVKA